MLKSQLYHDAKPFHGRQRIRSKDASTLIVRGYTTRDVSCGHAENHILFAYVSQFRIIPTTEAPTTLSIFMLPHRIVSARSRESNHKEVVNLIRRESYEDGSAVTNTIRLRDEPHEASRLLRAGQLPNGMPNILQ